MKRVIIIESDVIRVVEALRALAGGIRASSDPAWSRPIAIRVIDCVLSLNRNYDRFVVPRIEALMRAHPELQSVAQLKALLASHPSPATFVQAELNYDHADRARILAEVIEFLSDVVGQAQPEHEAAVLQRWAVAARPEEYESLNIKGFKLAGYQYLRMLFGAQTTKPDKHIIDFVSAAIRRRVSDVEALVLLEAATGREGLPLREVDTSIWEARARILQHKSPHSN